MKTIVNIINTIATTKNTKPKTGKPKIVLLSVGFGFGTGVGTSSSSSSYLPKSSNDFTHNELVFLE